MKAFADQRKAKPVFRRHVPALRVDQAGRARCLQRGQIRQILDSPRPQFKLTIGAPNDVYSQGADRVAGEVMRMPDSGAKDVPLRRICTECEEELQRQPLEEDEEEIQAKEVAGTTPVVTPAAEAGITSLRGGGQPLSESTRRFFEPRFGNDFGDVRVHTDDRAAETARVVNARAYTIGNDVAFARSEYVPASSDGRRLLAHELTHVLQRGGAGGVAAGERVVQRQRPLKGAKPAAIGEAVKILKASGKMSTGTAALSDALVLGIVKAEKSAIGISGAIAEAFGLGDTRGPGQIGEPAVDRVGKSFGGEQQKFAKVFGAPPSGWKDKVTHDDWAYFYIAGYLADRIEKAKGIFQVADTDSTINYGIVLYHGAFETMRDYRRQLAKRRGIADLKQVTWKLLVKEVEKSELVVLTEWSVHISKIVNIVEYVHVARGWPLPKVEILTVTAGE